MTPEEEKNEAGRNSFVTTGLISTGELGFEPRQADPESAVLPLHHSPSAKSTRTYVARPSAARNVVPNVVPEKILASPFAAAFRA